MKRFKKCVLIALALSIIGFFPNFGYSCSTFRIDHDNKFYLGKNYDWRVGNVLVVVKKRGVKKTAYLNPSYHGENPAVWTSKYGSVTFDQYACGFPSGGMNEAGLVVEATGLIGTSYPAADARPSINASQWRQYQLDNHSTVDEVITSNSKIRILRPIKRYMLASHHCLVSDKSGKCAVIEFREGKMVVYTGDTMPVMALTNSWYDESMDYWKKGAAPEFDRWKSFTRFIHAANMVREYGSEPPRPPVDYAFDILSQVSQASTKWSIVYDQNNLPVHFITYKNKKVRTVDLNKLDFSCRTPVKVLDAHVDLVGDVTNKFQNYTQKINRDLIRTYFKGTFRMSIPPETLDRVSRYPDSMTCDK